jgi:hypothetical protein
MLLEATDKSSKQISVAQSVRLFVRNDTQDFTSGKSSPLKSVFKVYRCVSYVAQKVLIKPAAPSLALYFACVI